MHLFGDASGAHLAHFQARREDGHVDLHWEVRNASGLRWRVLRAEHEFAEDADPLPTGQTLVSESSEGHVCDRRLVAGTPYFYTLFVKDEHGLWQRQVTIRLAQREHLHWPHPAHEDQPTETALRSRSDPRARRARLCDLRGVWRRMRSWSVAAYDRLRTSTMGRKTQSGPPPIELRVCTAADRLTRFGRRRAVRPSELRARGQSGSRARSRPGNGADHGARSTGDDNDGATAWRPNGCFSSN